VEWGLGMRRTVRPYVGQVGQRGSHLHKWRRSAGTETNTPGMETDTTSGSQASRVVRERTRKLMHACSRSPSLHDPKQLTIFFWRIKCIYCYIRQYLSLLPLKKKEKGGGKKSGVPGHACSVFDRSTQQTIIPKWPNRGFNQ